MSPLDSTSARDDLPRPRAGVSPRAMRHAAYLREIRKANEHLERVETRRRIGRFLYGALTFFGSMWLWDSVLPKNGDAMAHPGLAWALLVTTWVCLLLVRPRLVRLVSRRQP